jgi:23S rRNA (adenine2503-C2)-methyltransferase
MQQASLVPLTVGVPPVALPSWLGLSQAEQERWLTEAAGQPKFRRKQIEKWIFQQRASDFAQMTDLPQVLRERLAAAFSLFTGQVVKHQVSRDGTEKLLIEYPAVGRHGPGRIECVLIREKLRRTICVSSQVGCGMGCVFCASGLDGVDRSLQVNEILEQMLRITALLPADERLSHIVMMGMGEPLANLGQVLPALEVASSDLGLGISPRRITISTVGLPKSIDRLLTVGKRYQLAISLHAPTDALRNQIVPTNDKVGIAAIMEAADRFKVETGRRLTFEYVLLGGVNDTLEAAEDLAELLAGRDALLNLIPYNPVAGLPYVTPSGTAVARFRQVLEDRGVVVKCRQRKGDDIDAACGQLRRVVAAAPIESEGGALAAAGPGSVAIDPDRAPIS